MIERVVEVTDELVAAFARLLPQLSTAPPPDRDALAAVIANAQLFVARDASGQIAGALTLTVFHIPTGVQARIDDVVVDDAARGQGLGAALCMHAIEAARVAGAAKLDLTSRPARAAANRLYLRLGFERVETNCYRFTL